jgi:uncharacterized membrane protein
MHEGIQDFIAFFSIAGEIVTIILEAISVICIIIGIFVSIVEMARRRKSKTLITPFYLKVRIKFGGWLVLALEYQLAADIVGTTIAPTTEHLIRLGAIAVIRTFLNYFLNKEIKEEIEYRKIIIESNKFDDSNHVDG